MRDRERGMTLVEVLVSLAIVAVIVAMTTSMISTAMRSTQNNINKQFATQKALSMLEELRALIQTQTGTTTVVLDDFDDGTTNQPLLTTQRTITDPAHAASGNTRAGGQWLFERRITVQRVQGASDLRIVNVKVFVREGAAAPRLLAEVAGVLSTIGQNMPPTQVYDVYLIAVENVPGWWLYMQHVVPFVESAMLDLEARHPGLQFRRHWIRKLSYGRDPLYTPFVNRAADSTQPINSVYFYPGLMPSGSAVDNYYPPDFFSARVSIDGTVVNGGSPLSYALADQYNHAMRYPDELALFQQRVAAGLESADAPTFRLLLDDMVLRPALYRNAIIINLHGELFPFPPIRNYSDAAKDPARFPYVRVVTHPERIHYGNGDGINLRVYSYHTNVASPASVPDRLAEPITVVLRDVRWTPGAGVVTAIAGGIDADGNGSPDPYPNPPAAASTTPSAAGMWWSYQIVGNDTVLRLYNSPLKAPCVTDRDPCDLGGLRASKQLYALEYVPSPVEDLPSVLSPAPFTTTLASPGNVAKNTARWVISIPPSMLAPDRAWEFQTRIGDGNAVSNLSRTYVWRGTDVWLFGNAANGGNMPMSERFQIIGDPRHCPYADLKLPHAGSGRDRSDPLGMGYNRYFDDFHTTNALGGNAAGTWPGWSYDAPLLSGNWYGIKNNAADNTRNNDGWNTRSGYLEIDAPRMFQILRTAVIRSNSVFTTMTGFSWYYAGIGGEIGYDAANNFPNSIPVSARPFTGGAGTHNEQSITDEQSGGVKYIRENSAGDDYWWSMNWLGELAPDSQWNTWSSTGNLPTGNGAGTFSRVLRGSITARLPSGTTLIDTVRRTQEEGSTAFFWSGGTNATFHHRFADNTSGSLATEGQAVASTYKLPIPGSISNNRPFDINVDDTGMNPDHFLQSAYGAATTLRSLSQFYQHQSGIPGSALLAMRDGGSASFVVVNGLSPTGTSGISFIARWSFLSLIQSFLASGLYATNGTPDPARVRELPRVVITNPNNNIDINNPATISVAWTAQWRRWDGLPYTPSYANGFAEDTAVRFAVLYSRDNGRTWLHMQDDSPASPGVRPALSHLQVPTTFSWNVPASRFPKGNYLIRIEAYRDEVPLHYSFHQYRAFIKRDS